MVTDAKWQQFLNHAPDYFVVSVGRLLPKFGCDTPTFGLDPPAVRSVLLDYFTYLVIASQQTMYDMLKTKLRGAFQYQTSWMERYPGSTLADARLMMVMCSECCTLRTSSSGLTSVWGKEAFLSCWSRCGCAQMVNKRSPFWSMSTIALPIQASSGSIRNGRVSVQLCCKSCNLTAS